MQPICRDMDYQDLEIGNKVGVYKDDKQISIATITGFGDNPVKNDDGQLEYKFIDVEWYDDKTVRQSASPSTKIVKKLI